MNDREQEVCRLRYSTLAGVMGYNAVRKLCDMRDGDGEDVTDVRPRDYDGKPLDGYVGVRGLRAKYPSYEQIGERLGLTSGQVRGILDDARGKIGKALRWRVFMQQQEARYV